MSIKQMMQALFEKLNEIEDEFAIQHAKGIRLYFDPVDELGEEVILKNKSGRRVDKILSKGPYKSAAEEFQI